MFRGINTTIAFLLIGQAFSSPRYMAVGGGYHPFHSEASLEKNILTFQSLTPYNAEEVIYFGAGEDKNVCDVIEKDSSIKIQESIVFDIFGIADSQDFYQCKFRPNNIKQLSGPSEKNHIIYKLRELASRTGKDKRPFRFYFTGHGGHGSTLEETDVERYKYNLNTLLLWNKGTINVSEFTKTLNLFPEDAPIQILMVQCYSGGFSQINYKNALIDFDDLSSANRCGFFSQIFSEVATGCTPDVRNSIDYSHYFFQAYQKGVDYNGDRITSSSEAHAFAKIYAPSIDVPVSTSEGLLIDLLEIDEDISFDPYRNLLWNDIDKNLSTERRTVIMALAKSFGIDLVNTFTPPYISAINIEEKLMEKTLYLDESLKTMTSEYNHYVNEISQELINKYPAAGLFPQAFKNKAMKNFTESEYKKALLAASKHPLLPKLKSLKASIQKKEVEIDSMKKAIRRSTRLIREFKYHFLAEEIKDQKYATIKTKYDQLLKCEREAFFK